MTYHELIDEVNELNAQIEELETALYHEQEEYAELTRDVEHLERDVTILTIEVCSLEMAIDAQAKIIAKLKKQLEEVNV